MNKPLENGRLGGNDAVCFTAGPKGAVFGIGVIHAWLAADRIPPEAAAGISAGALTAAAMQYAFRALEDPAAEGDLEVRRWTWFRKYLDTLSDSPLDIVWKAIPDPVDFFADKPPVKDLSRPPSLDKAEAAARRDYYVLTRLGTWLAGLPVTVRTVASAAITYVRWKERYGMWGFMGLWFVATVVQIAIQVLYQLCFPSFFSQRTFRTAKEPGKLNWLRYHIWSWRFRPLFGWRVWLASIFAAGLLVYSALGTLLYLAQRLPEEARPLHPGPFWTAILAGTMAGLIIVMALLWRKRTRKALLDWATSQALEVLGVPRGLLNDYQLHRRLLELFAEDANAYPPNSDGPLLEEQPIQLVLVATALQRVTWKGKQLRSQQVWAEPKTPLTQALRAALCVQGLFPPLGLSTPKDIGNWVDANGTSHLDLVDGAGVSQNPLPAFFGWLKSHTDIAEKLKGANPDDRRVHIVYSVPIQPYQPAESQPERMNIVEVAFVSRELERRRDTRQEARQTNFISQLEMYVSKTGGRPDNDQPPLFPIFVDEIAPEKDVAFQNNLDPKADEIRKTAAAGCRQTLETLYRDELAKIGERADTVPRVVDRDRPAARESHLAGVSGITGNMFSLHTRVALSPPARRSRRGRVSELWPVQQSSGTAPGIQASEP